MTAVVLACQAGSAHAAIFSYKPCDTDGYGGHGWTTPANQVFLVHSDCDGASYQGLQIPTIDPTPSISTLRLRSAPIDSVEFLAKGRDRTAEGVQSVIAVCRGDNYPADCGTPVSGPSVSPFIPIPWVLSAQNGGIPAGADRLMLRSVCTRNELPDFCSTSTDETRFENIYVLAIDNAHPQLSEFAGNNDWVNTPPIYSVEANDEASGIVSISASQYGSSIREYTCDQPDLGCPLTAYAQMNTDLLPVYAGKNTITISTEDASNHVTSRNVSFRLDRTNPSKPTGLSVGGTNGWVVGNHATLNWTNGFETEPSIYGSGIVSATVTLEPASYGPSPPPPPKTYEGVAISTVPLDLPWPDTWTVKVRLTDGAGNVSDEAALTFDNEESGPQPVYGLSFPPINIARAEAGVTLRWSAVGSPRSGICGYRGWIGKGAAPDLAADSKSLISDVFAKWVLSASGLRSFKDGANTISIAAIDCAGVVGAASEASLIIDRVPPTATLTPGGSWYSAGTKLKVDGVDPGNPGEPSGVASVWYRIGGGPKVSANSDSAEIPLDAGVSTITYGVVDAAGNETAYPSRSVGIDSTAPDATISPVDGDPGAYRANVHDDLSGVVDAWCEMRAVGSNGWTRVGDRFVAAAGTTLPVELRLRLLEDELPTGDYELRVVARDAAGNALSALARTVHLPLRPASALTAGLARTKHRRAKAKSITLNLGEKALLGGSLRDGQGQPIAGAVLRVTSTRADGGRRVLGSLRTAADGGYSFRLGKDVSRSLAVQFDGDAVHGPAAAVANASVRARIGLKLSRKKVRRGRPLTAYGRITLLSASVPSRGIPIELRLCTKKRCSRANISGRSDSEGGYRIAIPTNVHRRTRYRVRAVVRGVPGWPFADGQSKIAKVEIR